MGRFSKQAIDEERENFIPAGFTETAPGVYDSRNWDEIRKWANEIAGKI
jgi:hypothetical protein